MAKILHTADWQLGKQFENLGVPSDTRGVDLKDSL
jgi:DNA repair exonuclease SbcCD nuclease subunit